MKQRDIDRFWSKVDKSSECWTWLGTVSNSHAVISIGGKACYAVRVAWELERGAPPQARINLRRTCGNRLCIRPDHRSPFVASPRPWKVSKPAMFDDMPNVAATYYILNLANHRIYVGMTGALQTRFRAHWGSLNSNHHQSSALQSDWNTYGRDVFEFGVLVDGCYPHGTDLRFSARTKPESFEDMFVRAYQSDNPQFGYNIGHFQGRAGLAFTHLEKLGRLADLWNIGGKRRDNETIRRCIDFTYQSVFPQEQP